MQNVQSIKPLGKSYVIELLFLFWLFCLPFGSSIGGVSVGFFTIYPSLVLLLSLFPLAVSSFKLWNPKFKYFTAFLLLWFLYGLIYPKLFATEFHSEWKFDVRSLALQFITSSVIIGMYYKLGKAKFYRNIKIGIVYFLFLIISFALFEFYSGIHFQGSFTDRLLSLDVVSELYYAPVFVYDNPNDFMVYLVLVLFIYLSLKRDDENKWESLAILILAFLFAFVTNARIAQFVIFMLALVQLLRIFWQPITRARNITLISTVIGGLGILFLFLNNPMFLGPKYKKGELDTSGTYIEFPVSARKSDKLSSFQLRKNLILNGVEFIKEKPVFGLGPGGFKRQHVEKLATNPTETLVGPHNYPIELVAGYGVLGWLVLLFLGSLFLIHLRHSFKQKKFRWIVFSIPVYLLCSFLPSSFMYMDISWMFVALIVILTFEDKEPLQRDERA